MYELSFSDSQEGRIENVDELSSRLAKMVEILDVKGDFSLTFVSDGEIRDLNREYRDRDEATDVLTFRLKDDSSFPSFDFMDEELGDIFISLDAVSRNAETFSVPLIEELTRVMLHGILHLLGFDHESNDFTKEEMLIRQEDILSTLGYKA